MFLCLLQFHWRKHMTAAHIILVISSMKVTRSYSPSLLKWKEKNLGLVAFYYCCYYSFIIYFFSECLFLFVLWFCVFYFVVVVLKGVVIASQCRRNEFCLIIVKQMCVEKYQSLTNKDRWYRLIFNHLPTSKYVWKLQSFIESCLW